MVLDLAKIEAAEASLDKFVAGRSAARRKANDLEEMYAESVRRDRERRRRENRALWYDFHCRLQEAHARIAARHEARALALLEEPGRGESRR